MKGHIQQRGRETWRILYDIPGGRGGERRQTSVTVHGAKRDAQVKLRELLGEVDRGDHVAPSQLSVGAYLERWMANYVRTNTSLRTQDGYVGIINRYLLPELGGMKLRDLHPDQIQGLYAQMGRRGLSSTTIRHTHTVLSAALKRAVKWRLIARNVCEAVDAPRTAPTKMRALTVAEAGLFIHAALDSKFHPVYVVLLYTGLRRSEVLALEWANIDLEGNSVQIVGGLHRIAHRGLVMLPTKSDHSRRRVSIPVEAVDALKAVRARQAESRLALGSAWQKSDLVFTLGDGRPVDPGWLTKDFAKVRDRAQLDGTRLHDLRHTHASLMLMQGVHPKVVSERLGHASTQITMDIYSHVLPGIQDEAAESFAKLLRA